jgi:glycosyltransferase involved in cell wall biosynthesis
LRVAIANLQDPGSAQTWSGVPYRLAPALERRGIEPVLLAVREQLPPRLRGYLEYQLRLRGLSPRRWADPGLGVRRVIVFGRSDYLRLGTVRARHARNLERALAEEGLDQVIHMGGLSLPLQPGGAEHYLVCDATWHTIAADVSDGPGFPAAMSERFDGIDRSLFAVVSHFFALSQHVAADLRSHYGVEPERITVVGSGPGWIEPFTGAKDYGNRRLLFVCKDRFEEKGGQLLLDAFRLAGERVEGLTLTMVTGERHPRRPPKVPNVTWRRGLSRGPELGGLFREASLYAAPGLVEPWGLVYLEALASKTPILGLRRHAFPELAGDGAYGFIVDEPTPEAVAEALVEAVSDPERLRRMGEQGQRHCLSTYSWDLVAERIDAVLRSGVDRGPA